MNAKTTSWDDLRLFLAVATTPTLGAAAAAAGVDKSTVSRRVAALEKSLGARLFSRTRDGLKPSEAGLRLRAVAEEMQRAAARARQEIDEGGDDARGRVRLATTEGLAAFVVERGLLDVCNEHPGVSIEILAGNRVLDLARGEADLALRLVKPAEAALKVRRLRALPVGAFASAGYVQARGHPRRLAHLAGHDLLVAGGDLARLPEARLFEEAAAGGRARVKLRTSSMPALASACAAGHGVAALTLPWGRRIPGVVELFTIEEVAPRPLWLAFPPAQGERRAVRVVLEKLAVLA